MDNTLTSLRELLELKVDSVVPICRNQLRLIAFDMMWIISPDCVRWQAVPDS